MIETTASCDASGCNIKVPAEKKAKFSAEYTWPDNFLVIEVKRARQGVKKTGEFGFCSRECFSDWAYDALSRS